MKKLLCVCALLSLSAVADTWNDDNNPAKMNSNYNYRFDALPLQATLPLNKMPWSASYWPRKKGGINYRWNTSNPTGYDLKSPSRLQVERMSLEDLAKLAPAEKYDLARGDYSYSLSKLVDKQSKKTAKDFEGLCDGWTASAIQFTEPAPVNFTNPDGIVIPFGSSDVKALMSYDVSLNGVDLAPVFVGRYCASGIFRAFGSPRCDDINPGAFHVILANQIGLMHESFAVDVDPGRETWNQPVYGYEFEVRGMTTAEGAAKALIIHAKFKFAADDPEGEDAKKIFGWDPVVGTENFVGETEEYDYVLELDYSGRIIGGSWLGASKKHHPDLFWKPTKQIEFTPRFQIINQLYKAGF